MHSLSMGHTKPTSGPPRRFMVLVLTLGSLASRTRQPDVDGVPPLNREISSLICRMVCTGALLT